ncbi:MAG: hypothetical protein EAY75_02260 [Bacteroidetes bacterium]|nr:MAG: hypothetical protein EAY75_02260 [Bacteroidota bacterium]
MANSYSQTATTIKRWLKGQWMVQHVPFVLFLALLAVLYIANGHYTDSTERSIAKKQKELKQLQYQYKTQAAELMYRTKESALVTEAAKQGLLPLQSPPATLKPNP